MFLSVIQNYLSFIISHRLRQLSLFLFHFFQPAFNLRFQAQFQRLPSTPFVLQAYDAVRVLLLAMEAVATTDEDGALTIDRTVLAEEMRSRAFLGLTGRIEFDEHGDRLGETARELGLVLYRVANAQFVPVE